MSPYLIPQEQSESLTIDHKDNSIVSYDPHESLLASSLFAEDESYNNLVDEIERLKEKWLHDTRFDSGYSTLINHPAHLRIVSFGERVIPYLIRDMQKHRTPWFYALTEITGENPISEESWGKIDNIIQDWLAWAKKNNYV